MNEKKHTPTPWKAVQDDDSWAIATCKAGWGIEYIAREIEQGHTNGEADAAHIVHCVNTYEEREALLKELVDQLNKAHSFVKHVADQAIDDDLIELYNEISESISDTLTKSQSFNQE